MSEISAELNGGIDRRITQLGEVPEVDPYLKFYSAELAKEIKPDEVQINTPLRFCSVKSLPEQELNEIERMFTGLNTISVYHSSKPKTKPLDMKELIKRRRMEP